MSDKVILSRVNRDALYAELLDDLSKVEDLRRYGEKGDPETMEKLEEIGRRATDALLLIQDGGLGWGYPEDEEPIKLTLPVEELRRIMEARRARFASLEESERAQRDREERFWRRTREAREACTSVLDQLGGR